MIRSRLLPVRREAAVIRSSPPEITPHFMNTETSTRAHATTSIAVSSTTAIRRSPRVARREGTWVAEVSVLRIGTTPDSSSRCCPRGTFTPHQLQRRNFASTVLLQRGHSMGGLSLINLCERYFGSPSVTDTNEQRFDYQSACLCCCFFSRNLRAYSPSESGCAGAAV